MGEQWRVDNNGTGETVSIYEGERVVADVYDDTEAFRIVAAVNRATGDAERIAELEAALRHLEVIVDDAISVGEMQGEDFRLSPWADMQAVSGRYAHLTALSASTAPEPTTGAWRKWEDIPEHVKMRVGYRNLSASTSPRADAEGQGES